MSHNDSDDVLPPMMKPEAVGLVYAPFPSLPSAYAKRVSSTEAYQDLEQATDCRPLPLGRCSLYIWQQRMTLPFHIGPDLSEQQAARLEGDAMGHGVSRLGRCWRCRW